MNKLLLAAATASIFGSVCTANASNTILFDPTGGGGAILVDTFDWAPDNGLSVGVFSTPDGPGGFRSVQLVAQGKLGSFIQPGNINVNPAAGEFTFQASFFENVFGAAAAVSASFADLTKPSSFDIFWHPTVCSNQLAGTGYGLAGCAGAVNILHGELAGLTGAFIDQTLLLGVPIGDLDQFGANNTPGTFTRVGNGSSTVQVNVLSQNNSFFISNVTDLLIDLQDTTNTALPFAQANPAALVVGFTPQYSLNAVGARVNGENNAVTGLCDFGSQTATGAAGTRCDLQLQTDASSSFNSTNVPEPATLALTGLALAGLGLTRRRKGVA